MTTVFAGEFSEPLAPFVMYAMFGSACLGQVWNIWAVVPDLRVGFPLVDAWCDAARCYVEAVASILHWLRLGYASGGSLGSLSAHGPTLWHIFVAYPDMMVIH